MEISFKNGLYCIVAKSTVLLSKSKYHLVYPSTYPCPSVQSLKNNCNNSVTKLF